ncbi:hypothetical protein [Desulfovibrio litoralis]|uniref:Uncharacterized protein n=1 Tax=Desulfovibrio litoralis DSM 11393 TaxID=1121455 RepID=A0A1M7THA3_9BACT|nr:hypothetical protein [Desulfovibrio litoralis]SHN70132.1 hypothetical protein SAMN02745728_02002 [Desulfovibrio litoralis DSM 11393]
MSANILLQRRLKNCIETILELEPVLEQFSMGKDFLTEFNRLKSFMTRLDNIFSQSLEKIREDDVMRIELATATFLQELNLPESNACERLGQQIYLQ